MHPTIGYSGYFLSRGYLTELWAAMTQKAGFRPGTPWLVGLSAGGRGAIRVYNERPRAFVGLIGLSTAWSDRDIDALPREGVVRLVVGAEDEAASKAVLEAMPGRVARRVANFRNYAVPGGHLGLLFEPEAYDTALRAAVRE